MYKLRSPATTALRHTLQRTTLPPQSHNILNRIQQATYSSAMDRSAGPPLTNPLNIPKWYELPFPLPPSQLPSPSRRLTQPNTRLEANSHLLKPPVNNYLIYNDPMTVMIVGGPNARTDYHLNSTPEFFFQYKGRMLLKTIEPTTNEFKDIYINEGELFLLPGNVPHNPVRFADTVGVVIEQPRPEGSLDSLMWFCQDCGTKVHQESFHCTDLGTQIKKAVQEFEANEEARKCGKCGAVCDVKPKADVMEKMRTAPS
jgi:3-hydroxyanthranilate 3,4-dioxygenase